MSLTIIQQDYLKYFILKYISIFYNNLLKNQIIIKFYNNQLIIYFIIHNNSYNIQKQFYLQKSLKNLTNLNVYCYILNYNLNFIKTKKNKKLIFRIFKKYNKIKQKLINFNSFFLIFIFSLYFKNLKFLIKLISYFLKKTLKHFQFLKNLNFFFNFFKTLNKNLKGIKIQIKGRLNGSLRSKKYILNIGTLNNQTIKNQLYFHKIQCNTIYGICGIKLWIAFF